MTKKTSKKENSEKLLKLIFTEQFKKETPENQKIITDFLIKCSFTFIASNTILKVWYELNKTNKKLNEEEK